jgi:hypothetical protein
MAPTRQAIKQRDHRINIVCMQHPGKKENGRDARRCGPARRFGPAILSSLARAAGCALKKIKKVINVRGARDHCSTMRVLHCAALQQKRYSNVAIGRENREKRYRRKSCLAHLCASETFRDQCRDCLFRMSHLQ